MCARLTVVLPLPEETKLGSSYLEESESQEIKTADSEAVEQKFEAKQSMVLCDPATKPDSDDILDEILEEMPGDAADGKY